MSDYKLSHLQELEAESIHIIREVAAEFENRKRLFRHGSPGRKGFFSGKSPFPFDAHRFQMEV